MSIKDLILRIVDKQKIEFDVIRAPDAVSLKENWLEATVPMDSVCRTAFFEDDDGIVIALYPASRAIHLATLRQSISRDLKPLNTDECAFKLLTLVDGQGLDLSTHDAFKFIIDEHLTNQDYVHFEGTAPCSLIRIDSNSLELFSRTSFLGCSFTEVMQQELNDSPSRAVSIKERLANIDRLPAMPEMPQRILNIRNNPNSGIDELVEVVSLDMALSAQIIRYANSPMFRVDEPVTSLKDAIFRVLGYETVLHIALGYALGRVFKLPEKGPLGHQSFWQHSTYSAALAQKLALAMPKDHRPKPGIAYLSGLLHDIGFLVLNMLFKNEHAWLNKMMAAHPDKSAISMERRLLGISHSELGAWLMKSWGLPEEVCVTVQHHHNSAYDGPFAEYALLLNLCERLLKTHGMSDADSDEIPASLLKRLGLEEESVIEMTDEVLQGRETLQEMAINIA